MGVYLPTAAVGNGRILAALGASGEVMGLFWPRLDYAQNVHECLPALYLGHPQQGRFLWTWQAEGARQQAYLDGTDILVTEVALPAEGVGVTMTDFCPLDEACLVRRAKVENRSSGRIVGAFFHYFELWLGETEWKQGVHLEANCGCMLQYFRDFAAAVGGTPADMWRCGKWTRQDDGSARVDMYDGHLNGQPEDIGQVNFALGWRLNLAPGEAREVDILVAMAPTREEAGEAFVRLRQTGAAALQARSADEGRAWLARGRPLRVQPWMSAAARRALLSARMLCDWATGAVIAAPEFDPGYEMCGGYGYCWPRDAADAVLALDEAGYPEFLAAAAAWMVGAQLPGGVWGQRYWCDGQVASSWALRDDFLQLDETSSALLLLCRAGAAGDGQPDARLVEAIRAGAAALLARLSPEGYHASACDLWETYAGTFAYTQASVAAALRESAALLERLGDPQAAAIRAAADMARKAALSFYRGGYFLRGRMDGRLDTTADSSTLGLVEPFGVLDLRNPAHWEMARSNLLVIERRLGFDYPDGRGIRRYEGDPYLGGAVGAVNTLWAALVCYRLAETAADTAERKTLTGRAELYLRTVLARTTPAGLLPELLPNLPGVPYWAAPHAWASGLVVKCALAASRLGAEADSRGS